MTTPPVKCRNGHAMTPANTATRRGGSLRPRCRECNRAASARHREKLARRTGHVRRTAWIDAVLAMLPTSGCVLWPGARLDRGGYALSCVGRRTVVAHRRVYELVVGPIPAEMELDHLCRVRRCVNPAHMEPVTSQENSARAVEATYSYDPRKTCRNGHPKTAENVYRSATGDTTCRPCNRATAARSKARRASLAMSS